MSDGKGVNLYGRGDVKEPGIVEGGHIVARILKILRLQKVTFIK